MYVEGSGLVGEMYRGDRHQHSGQGEEREVMGQKERKAVAAFAQGKPCMLKD